MTVPGRGWYAEITHPDSGHVFTPDIVDASREPAANALPRISLTLRKDENWANSSLEGAAMGVWKDGRPQPIDELETVDDSQERTRLEGVGGVDLLQRVQRDINQNLVHLVAEDIIKNNTSYTANVDTPQVSDISDAVIRNVDSNDKLTDLFADNIADTDPLKLNGTKIETLQSGFFTTTSDFSNSAFEISSGDSAYVDDAEGGKAAFLSGARRSSKDSISTVTPSGNVVSVQTGTESNGVVRVYDSGGSFLGETDATAATDLSSTWVDIDTGGTAVDQVRLADTDGTPDSEAVNVNSDTGGTGGTTNTTDVNVKQGQSISFTFTPSYVIPQDDFGLYLRITAHTPNGEARSNIRAEVQFDSNVANTQATAAKTDDYKWDIYVEGDTQLSGDVDDSQHTVEIFLRNADDSGGAKDEAGMAIDVAHPRDERYSYTNDDTVDTNNGDVLSGPENYPDNISLEGQDVTSTRRIKVAKLDSTWNDTGNSQALALSDDQGNTFTSSANTETISVDFADDTIIRYRAKLTFSRFSSGNGNSPTDGDSGQTADSLVFKADVDGTPHVSDTQFDAKGVTVLNQLADIGDFLWEYRVDRQGNKSVEWTLPGQRTTTRESPVAAWQRDRKGGPAVTDKITVKGSAQPVEAEAFTADHGNAVDLEQSQVQKGKERVYNPSNGTVYDGAEIDYKIDAQTGTITTLSGGNITDGESLEIDYEFRPSSSFEANTPVNVHETIELPQVTSQRAADIQAREIGQEIGDPLVEGRIIIPSDEIGWSVVEAITFEELPIESDVEVRSIENVPGQTVLRVGSRKRLQDVVDSIRQRLNAAAERV